MKVYIFAFIMIIISVGFTVFEQDYERHQERLNSVKFVAEEAAAAAAQLYYKDKYADGTLQFNQAEGIKACEYVIKSNLNLNDDFTPKAGNYWRDRVTYTIEFFDDTNLKGPFFYEDTQSGYTNVIIKPAVVVSINCGKARYRMSFITSVPPSLRLAAHEWDTRG